MRIIHYFDEKLQVSKNVRKEASFLLTSRLGDYLWLQDPPLSRYQGWFFVPPGLSGKSIFKVIENIKPVDAPSITELKNNFWNIERKRGALKEEFFLPLNCHALVYEVSQPRCFEVFFDIKESYQNSEEGRVYEISKEKDLYIVKYHQQGRGNSFFVAVKAKGSVVKKEEWLLRRYPFDQERHSPPFERYVFKGLKINALKTVFAVAQDKAEAIRWARYVFYNTAELKAQKRKEIATVFQPLLLKKSFHHPELALASLCACNSLAGLLVNQKKAGIYGGLPWFFQFWPRDEALSLKALAYFKPAQAKEILLNRLECFAKQKDAPAFSEGIGWFLKRADDFIEEKLFKPKEIPQLIFLLQGLFKKFLKQQSKSALFFNPPKESWMDTIERFGAKLELQSLLLNAFKLAAKQSKTLSEKKFYLAKERELKREVQEKFWNKEILADTFDSKKGSADFTLRPNLFLAYYLYPQLLKKGEWAQCFVHALKRLFLSWGGLATIAKDHPLFYQQHTGEPAISYHQGDSWFYLNNLTALVLLKTDKQKFQRYISKILQASTQEILWGGIIGHQAELSSASGLKSQGCLAQAWSSALYLELGACLEQRKDLHRSNGKQILKSR